MMKNYDDMVETCKRCGGFFDPEELNEKGYCIQCEEVVELEKIMEKIDEKY